MFKGKEGIALILAIVFMLAITILLSAVLLLSTQEINATQLYLDSNKALYYAEAGVEYAQARILKAEIEGNLNSNFLSTLSSPDTDNSLKNSFNDINIKSVNLTAEPGSSANTYRMTCEVKYNRTTRKITKEIRILYPGLWDKAMASDGNINLSIKDKGYLTINGNIHSNSNIIASPDMKDPIYINGNVTASGTIDDKIIASNGYSKTYPVPKLTFPLIDWNYYKSLVGSKNYFNSGDNFINALNRGEIDMSSKPVYVYIKADGDGWDFKLENLRQELIISDICIIVDGEVKFNNNKSEMTIGSDSYVITFIARELSFVNINRETTFKNMLLYSLGNVDFQNLSAKVMIEGSIYSEKGYIGLDTIKAPIEIKYKKWNYSDVSHLFDLYQVERWSDASV